MGRSNHMCRRSDIRSGDGPAARTGQDKAAHSLAMEASQTTEVENGAGL